MKIVMLWTDYFIYALFLIALMFVYRIYGNEQLQQTWKKVLYQPLNLVASMILIVYLAIGLLDSVHFKNGLAGENKGPSTISVLDKILAPIAYHQEKTYSAPFATHAFTKEATTLPDGTIIRDYPRLNYGGAHLEDPNKKWQDIRHRSLMILLQAAIIWSALSILVLMLGCFKHRITWNEFFQHVCKGNTCFPWRTFLLTFGVMLVLFMLMYGLMPYYHIFGTSQVGEDVLYQTLKSIRTGLVIGILTTIVTLPFAILFGIMAGYFRGWIDDIIQYIYTTLSSIPGVLLIAAAVLTLQVIMGRHADWFQTEAHRSDARLLALCFILGITSWTGLCRLLRGETLKISQIDYIQAALSLGCSHYRIIYKHILPNVFHIILITIALDFSGLVLAEAVLSYVGVGVDPSSYSWGTMINSARLEMARAPVVWWNLSAAFVFMFILVLAANIFSDALRDAFDPRATITR